MFAAVIAIGLPLLYMELAIVGSLPQPADMPAGPPVVAPPVPVLPDCPEPAMPVAELPL